jgi:hypothetical protein
MALERDLELIDDYLSNKMQGSEKDAFEQRLQHDNALSKELTFQKQLVSGIREARVAQLKSMLNSIPVTSIPTSQTSLLTKIGSVVVVTGSIITASYFYFKDQPTEPTQADSVKTEETLKPVIEAESETEHSNTVEKTEPEQPISKSNTPEETKTAVKSTEAKPVIKAYDPTTEEEKVQQQAYEKEQLEIVSHAFVTSSIEVDIHANDTEHQFHYVFNEGRLVLYGSFERNLYEILEFIKEDDRTIVLFYKSNYYLLDESKASPTALQPIRNKELLNKLKSLRGN